MTPTGFYKKSENINNTDFAAADKTFDLSDMNRRIDGLRAVRQAVVKILSTEKYRYPVYREFGIVTEDLTGLDCDYACVELERRITEALTADERIKEVSGFEFTVEKGVIRADFTVHCAFGNFRSEREIAV